MNRKTLISMGWAVLMAVVVIGVPLGLVRFAPRPWPSEVPSWTGFTTAVSQGHIPSSGVIKAITLMVWVLWAQLMWALLWELAVNGRRLARGQRQKGAPGVAGPVNALAVRLVSGVLAVGLFSGSSMAATLPMAPLATQVTSFLDVGEISAIDGGSGDGGHHSPAGDDDDGYQLADSGQSHIGGSHKRIAVHEWKVSEGDSLWSIAEISLGDGGRINELMSLNPQLTSARSLGPGMILQMPVGASIPHDRIPAGGVVIDESEVEAGTNAGVRVETDAQPKAEAEPEFKVEPEVAVEVEVGDTLWGLSEQRLDNSEQPTAASDIATYLEDVVEENKSEIDDPDLIFPGQLVVLPELTLSEKVAHDWPPPKPATSSEDEQLPTGRAESQSENRAPSQEVDPALSQAGISDEWPSEVLGPEDITRPKTTIAVPEAGPSGSGGSGLVDNTAGTHQTTTPQTKDSTELALFAAGGFVLATGILGLVTRRRRYRQAHRHRGTTTQRPDKSLARLEQSLAAWADDHTLRWMTGALRTLSARPIWEGEEVSQPLLCRIHSERLAVEFSGSDLMGAPVPWTTPDGGKTWELNKSAPLDVLTGIDSPVAAPTFVTVANDVLINLEAAGVFRVSVAENTSGTDDNIAETNDAAMSLVRAMVHELATSASSATLDIRSTISIEGVDSYRLVSRQDPISLTQEMTLWLSDVDTELAAASSVSAFSHRVYTGEQVFSPVVIITDTEGEEELGHLVEVAKQRRLPVSIVVVGAEQPIDDDSFGLQITGEDAALHPWNLSVTPVGLDAATAERLGDLLREAETGGLEPVVVAKTARSQVSEDQHLSGSEGHTIPPLDDDPILAVRWAEDPLWEPAVPEVPKLTTKNSATPEVTGDDGDDGDADIVGSRDTANSADSSLGSDTDDRAGTGHSHEAGNPSDPAEGEMPRTPPSALVPLTELEIPSVITVKLLGPIGVEGTRAELTSQQLALLTFLACHGPASKATIVDSLWDGQVVSKSRFPNLLAELRARIGRHHLPEVVNHRYQVRGVTTDLSLFEAAVAEAETQEVEEAIATLTEALALVTGPPLQAPASRFWSWVDDRTHFAARIEALVADTAMRLAELHQTMGNDPAAKEACEAGLEACPDDETLVSMLTKIYLKIGNSGSAHRLVAGWEARIGRLECGDPSDGPRRLLVS